MTVPMNEVIEYQETPITQTKTDAFLKGTHSHYAQAIPPTYVTLFRRAEYDWLARLKIEIPELLHGDQQYEYLAPLQTDQPIQVRTKLASWKERNTPKVRLIFVVMESEIFCNQILAVRSRTTFVVRRGGAVS